MSSGVQWCSGGCGGVWGMSKPFYSLILICARSRAGVPERTICETILWFGQTMPWFGHKRGVPGPAERGDTLVGADLALDGRKRVWAGFGLCARSALVLRVKTRETPPSVGHQGIEHIETYQFLCT